jgi:hypothetical protein
MRASLSTFTVAAALCVLCTAGCHHRHVASAADAAGESMHEVGRSAANVAHSTHTKKDVARR